MFGDARMGRRPELPFVLLANPFVWFDFITAILISSVLAKSNVPPLFDEQTRLQSAAVLQS